MDLEQAQRGREHQAEHRSPGDVAAELAALRAAVSRHHGGRRQDRQCTPRGMDVAGPPAISLIEGHEEKSEQRTRERKSEKLQLWNTPPQGPPAGEREQRQAGDRPAPETDLLAPSFGDRFIAWNAENRPEFEQQVPNEVFQVLKQVVIRRIEQHGFFLQLPQEKPPARSENQRERRVTSAKRD